MELLSVKTEERPPNVQCSIVPVFCGSGAHVAVRHSNDTGGSRKRVEVRKGRGAQTVSNLEPRRDRRWLRGEELVKLVTSSVEMLKGTNDVKSKSHPVMSVVFVDSVGNFAVSVGDGRDSRSECCDHLL